MKTITIFLFTVLLNACSASGNTASNLVKNNKNSAQEPLTGTLTVYNIDGKSVEENLTLTFNQATKRVTGFSGCNTFFGDYIVNGNAISFKKLASTKMFCLDNKNLVEKRMMKSLGVITNFEVIDNKVMFLNGKKALLTAKKNSESKIAQENLKIQYRTQSRGNFKRIILENKTISIEDGFDSKPTIKYCSKEDWEGLQKMISTINLKTFLTLEAPSKAHQYDGAPIANFSITKDGEIFDVPPFDAGKPNTKIEEIVNMVIKIAKTTN